MFFLSPLGMTEQREWLLETPCKLASVVISPAGLFSLDVQQDGQTASLPQHWAWRERS